MLIAAYVMKAIARREAHPDPFDEFLRRFNVRSNPASGRSLAGGHERRSRQA